LKLAVESNTTNKNISFKDCLIDTPNLFRPFFGTSTVCNIDGIDHSMIAFSEQASYKYRIIVFRSTIAKLYEKFNDIQLLEYCLELKDDIAGLNPQTIPSEYYDIDIVTTANSSDVMNSMSVSVETSRLMFPSLKTIDQSDLPLLSEMFMPPSHLKNTDIEQSTQETPIDSNSNETLITS
jgi:hypothetical protein